MKRKIMRVLTLICLSLLSTTATAEKVDKRLDAAADGVVSISNIAGSVEVAGWSRKEVEVSGTLGKDVEELIFERDGNEIKITVRAPKRNSHDISSDLVVKVPEKSSIEIVGVSADIDVQNVHGTQHLQSVSGDIDSEAYSADIEIVTVSGDVELQGDDEAARTQLETVSGDVDAQNLAGEISANSVSGDLTLVNSNFDRVRLETVNGDIVFNSGLAQSGTFSLETINGDLDIDFNDSISARFVIKTFNGDIRNCFGPEPVRTSKYTPGTELKFTEGDGNGRVNIKTLNGDLRLCKG
jgi:DUF4097 and DUF4098 domain-containing protein YvlB